MLLLHTSPENNCSDSRREYTDVTEINMSTEEEKRKLALEMSGEKDKDDKPMSSRDKVIAEITERLEAAKEAQENGAQARKRAELTEDIEEKQKELEEAFKQEKKAAKELKIVQRLQSGVWQGGASGAGIGAGVGLGLGTVVGSVVGGVVSVPTTGLGLLAGAATGAIHGPWVKIPGMGKDENEPEPEEAPKEGKH